MNDETILGLLLRAHARASEQKHGEEFVHKNTSASMSYGTAVQSIESAIWCVWFAELAARRAGEET
jgi:hypothetical protein